MNKEELMEMVIEYLKEHVDTNDDRLEGVITEEFYHEVKETVEDFVQQLNWLVGDIEDWLEENPVDEEEED